MKRSEFWSHRIKPVLDVIQALGVAAAGIGLLIAASQLHLSELSESATLGLQFDNRLNQPAMFQISDDIESTPQLPILAPEGSTSEENLDEFLGEYDTIYYLHESGLINNKMLDDLFCTDAEDSMQDPEILVYLKQDRAQPDSQYDYIGLDKLALVCAKLDDNPTEEAILVK